MFIKVNVFNKNLYLLARMLNIYIRKTKSETIMGFKTHLKLLKQKTSQQEEPG